MHRNILLKFECLISQGGNVLSKLGMSHYSRFFEHYLLVFGSVKSKFEKPSISSEKVSLRNVDSIIKIDNL